MGEAGKQTAERGGGESRGKGALGGECPEGKVSEGGGGRREEEPNAGGGWLVRRLESERAVGWRGREREGGVEPKAGKTGEEGQRPETLGVGGAGWEGGAASRGRRGGVGKGGGGGRP
jgi:hypothetical protein